MTLTFQGHVTIRFEGAHFLYALHCHQVAISSRFRYNGHQTYWGHDLDLSGSRDVIGHVTIGLEMVHFLLVVLWTQVSISNGFRDIPPQTSCAQCS